MDNALVVVTESVKRCAASCSDSLGGLFTGNSKKSQECHQVKSGTLQKDVKAQST
jgi:hypothetical protein